MPGETIWLKAYLPCTPQLLNQTLLVRLADDHQNTIISREFPVYDIRAHGQLVLPDSIPAGQYTITAYGNNTGPATGNVFTQTITIVNNSMGMPTASVQLADSSTLAPGNSATLQFSLQANGRPVPNARGRYTITVMGTDTPLYTEKIKTDASGYATATVTYPQIGLHEHLAITGTFTVNDAPVPFNLMLPSEKKLINVTVMPEGGVAIAGLNNIITVQATDNTGQPVSGVSVTLTEDNKPVATALTNSYGLAVINYTLQDRAYNITATLATENFSAKIPIEVQKQGLSLTLEAGNKLFIRNTGPSQKTRLELWWQSEVLFEKELTVPANGTLPVSLPPSAESRIISAALFNPQGVLTNERVFYTGTQNGYTIMADFGTKKFSTRQNVTATLTVTDAEGNPVQANLSTAVVHRSLLNKNHYKIITASRYSAITDAGTIQRMSGFDNSVINNYLAGKKWRGNLKQPAAKPLTIAPGITGTLARKNKKPVHIKQITLVTPKGPQFITVEANGSFYIKPEYLLGFEGEKCYLFFPNDELDEHTVTLHPKDELAAAPRPEAQVYTTSHETVALPDIPGAIQVEEVIIEKKQRGFTSADYQKWARDYPDYCADYVCINNNLNCSYHTTGGLPPYIGREYNVNGRKEIYTHCYSSAGKVPQKIVNLSTIILPENFPAPQFEDEFDLKYYTTLVWVPNIDTDINGRATVQFTTSDLEGNFLMVLQGLNINNNDAIYGEAGFEVKGGR